jgi:glycosyltransferase involved in cell wall biosynthesis
MKIAFHLATPPAPLPELDAAVQEVERLRGAFGGSLCRLYPAARYRPWIPRRFLTPATIREMTARDRQVDLHHLVSDRLLDYPALRRLRRPIVYRLLTSPTTRPRVLDNVAPHGPVVVSSAADAGLLRSWGLPDAVPIPPGIDVDRFRAVGAPPADPFTIMMASAPWTRRQFVTKGVDALLEALRRRPRMRLVLLWRGVLVSAARRRIAAAGIGDRVDLIDGEVDVAEALGGVHVVVLATSSPRVVKAYPHSLLEALAAGRPVLTSGVLAIARWVREHGCGEVAACSPTAIGESLDRLANNYGRYRGATEDLDLSGFSTAVHLASYRALYERVLSGSTHTGGSR